TIGMTLYLRAEHQLLTIEKGFDSTNLVNLSILVPSQYYGSSSEIGGLASELAQRIRAIPGVIGAVRNSAPPSLDARVVKLEESGGTPTTFSVLQTSVMPEFFSLLRLPVKEGKVLGTGATLTDAVVSEALARRLWPEGQRIGRTIRRTDGMSFNV